MSDIIVAAISSLGDRIDSRFDNLEDRLTGLDTRVRKAETDLTRVKTLGGLVGALLTFVRWGTVRVWLTALTKS